MYNINNFDFQSFSDALGGSEGSNSYNAYNPRTGALGKYQFISITLNQVASELNIPVPSDSEFLNNPNMQESFYIQYAHDILNYINSFGLYKFLGESVTGKNNNITSNINIYGLVAGSWLGGVGGVVNLLELGIDANDNPVNPSQGTYISDYVSKFSQIFEKKT